MILGVGLDLADVPHIEQAVGRPRFLERVFTDAERERIALRGAETAAGVFAAKEAVAKALGTGFSGFGPWDIHVTWTDAGAPRVALSNGAEERRRAIGGGRIHLSITHSAGMAAAVAILTDEEEEA